MEIVDSGGLFDLLVARSLRNDRIALRRSSRVGQGNTVMDWRALVYSLVHSEHFTCSTSPSDRPDDFPQNLKLFFRTTSTSTSSQTL